MSIELAAHRQTEDWVRELIPEWVQQQDDLRTRRWLSGQLVSRSRMLREVAHGELLFRKALAQFSTEPPPAADYPVLIAGLAERLADGLYFLAHFHQDGSAMGPFVTPVPHIQLARDLQKFSWLVATTTPATASTAGGQLLARLNDLNATAPTRPNSDSAPSKFARNQIDRAANRGDVVLLMPLVTDASATAGSRRPRITMFPMVIPRFDDPALVRAAIAEACQSLLEKLHTNSKFAIAISQIIRQATSTNPKYAPAQLLSALTQVRDRVAKRLVHGTALERSAKKDELEARQVEFVQATIDTMPDLAIASRTTRSAGNGHPLAADWNLSVVSQAVWAGGNSIRRAFHRGDVATVAARSAMLTSLERMGEILSNVDKERWRSLHRTAEELAGTASSPPADQQRRVAMVRRLLRSCTAPGLRPFPISTRNLISNQPATSETAQTIDDSYEGWYDTALRRPPSEQPKSYDDEHALHARYLATDDPRFAPYQKAWNYLLSQLQDPSSSSSEILQVWEELLTSMARRLMPMVAQHRGLDEVPPIAPIVAEPTRRVAALQFAQAWRSTTWPADTAEDKAKEILADLPEATFHHHSQIISFQVKERRRDREADHEPPSSNVITLAHELNHWLDWCIRTTMPLHVVAPIVRRILRQRGLTDNEIERRFPVEEADDPHICGAFVEGLANDIGHTVGLPHAHAGSADAEPGFRYEVGYRQAIAVRVRDELLTDPSGSAVTIYYSNWLWIARLRQLAMAVKLPAPIEEILNLVTRTRSLIPREGSTPDEFLWEFMTSKLPEISLAERGITQEKLKAADREYLLGVPDHLLPNVFVHGLKIPKNPQPDPALVNYDETVRSEAGEPVFRTDFGRANLLPPAARARLRQSPDPQNFPGTGFFVRPQPNR